MSSPIVHDECGNELNDICAEAGIKLAVEPQILQGILPARVLQRRGDDGQPLLRRGKPGLVPDFMGEMSLPKAATARGAQRGKAEPARMHLMDVKTVFAGGRWYKCARARDEQAGAVAERAHKI